MMRHLAAAHEGEDFHDFARTVCARQVIAHVRQATAGDVSFENTHPFVDGPWVFAHTARSATSGNGVRDAMWDQTSTHRRTRIRGNTDSELLFALLLTRLEDRADADAIVVVAEVIRDVAAWCAAAGSCENLGLNIIMSDGRRILGTRWQQTLWMLERSGISDVELCGRAREEGATAGEYRAALIASEPLTTEQWSPVPERSVLELSGPPGATAVHADIRSIEDAA